MMPSTFTSSASSPADYRDFLSTSSAVHSVTATKFLARVWGKSFDKFTSKQTYESDTESFQYRLFRVPLLELNLFKEDFVIFNEYEAVWNDILQLRSLGRTYPALTTSDDTIADVDMDGSVIQDISFTADGRKVRLPTVIGVVGHPGIGKSIWLLYVLLRLLSASQPVLFPTDSEYDLFFCARGAYKIPHKDAVAVICDFLGPECWALVDAKYDVPERFRRSKLSIIQASSPREDRLHWLKKRNATRRYFMAPPSLQEYLAACYSTRRVPLKQSLFRSSYEKFGPSIRLALHSCRSLEAYDLKIRELVADIKSMDYDKFSEMTRRSDSFRFDDETPHKLFVTRPCRRREDHRLEYVSRFVEMLIRDQLQTVWANKCADFISNCSSTSRCLAAPAVELGFHSRLVQGGQLYLTPLANGGRRTLGRWSTEKVTVKWESDTGHARTHLLAIGRHSDEEEVSVTLYPSDSAPHLVSSASALSMLPRKLFSLTNPPVATFTAYWQPAAIDHMVFDSLIFDATSNTVFLFQLEVIEAADAKASSVLFVREHFPNASIHYILVSSSIFAETAFGEATSRWLPNKWHLRV